MKKRSGYRWFVFAVCFAFLLLHQSDRLLIGPLTTPIMETFGIDEAQMGWIFGGALIVAAVFYLIWGYLFDRYSRPKLLALASAIWGSTTWFSAIAPNFTTFFISRSSTGIDDSSYPGLFSLISDYFGPKMRGKVYGLLQLTAPLGYMIGLLAATMLGGLIGWRNLFYITGILGIILAVVFFLFVRDAPRGQSEPEMENLEMIGAHRFDKQVALGLFRKRSMLLLFAQGFVGIFPWNVITFWFFRYLEVDRGYDANTILFTMAPAILMLAAGYFVGGAVGDFFFRRTPRGRMLTAMFGVITGAVLLYITINIPDQNQSLFAIMMILTALFIPFAAPNVVSTVYDITLPEVRSTSLSIQYFMENGGAALAPILAGYIARLYSLETAILGICITAWVLGAVILGLTAYFVPADIHTLRTQMQERAQADSALQPAD